MKIEAYKKNLVQTPECSSLPFICHSTRALAKGSSYLPAFGAYPPPNGQSTIRQMLNFQELEISKCYISILVAIKLTALSMNSLTNHVRNFIVLIILSTSTATGQQHNVVVERATATWCAPCTVGKVISDSLEQANSRVIAIAIHYYDSMSLPIYSDSSGFSAFPTARFNRITDPKFVYNWFATADSVLNLPTLARLSVDFDMNASTRTLELNCTTRFNQNQNGDVRIAAVLIEDGIYSNQDGYGQSNYYSGRTTDSIKTGYESLPFLIPPGSILHNRVARELITPYSGILGSIPSNILRDTNYVYKHTYIVPQRYRLSHVYAVLMLVDHNTGQILDAYKTPYLDGSDNAPPVWLGSIKNDVMEWQTDYSQDLIARDPNSSKLEFSILNAPEWLTIEQDRKGNGRIFGTLRDTGEFNISLLVTDGELLDTLSYYIVVQNEDGYSWQPLGSNEGRPFELTNDTDLSGALFHSDSEGNCYVQIIENSRQGTKSIRTTRIGLLDENNQWKDIEIPQRILKSGFLTKLKKGELFIMHTMDDSVTRPFMPTLISVYRDGRFQAITDSIEAASYSDFEIHGNKVFLLKNRQQVMYYNGVSWSQLGSNFQGILQSIQGLEIDDHGRPYVLAYQQTSNRFKVYTLFNNSFWWETSAELPNFTLGNVLNVEMLLKDSANIVVSWRNRYSDTLNIYRWNGSAWLELSINAVLPSNTDYAITLDSSGNPIVLISDHEGTSCFKYTHNEWELVNNRRITNNPTSKPSIGIIPDGSIVATFGEFEVLSEGVRVMIHKKTLSDISSHQSSENWNALAYPNPVSDGMIYIEGGWSNAKYHILNMKGQIVREGFGEGSYIDVSGMSSGLYLLRIEKRVYRIVIH